MTITDVKESVAAPAAMADDSVLPTLNGRASPQHLRAVAQMYGVEAPPLETARVLTLGCDTGANLIPFCAAWPDAAVTSIDIDAHSITQGQRLIDRGGIANLQLYCLQLDELLSASPGEQDYIILQGMFTLLDNTSREAVLGWCQQHLSANGLIALQWPCYPGARNEETLRDAMLLHSSLAASEEEKISGARAAASWLAMGMAETNPQRTSLQSLLQGIDGQNDTILSLKYLSGLNEASYLIDFNNLVERNGLAYLGDAEPWVEIPSFYGADVAQFHKIICLQPNKVLRQQYLDFAVNRQQRFSLLVGQQHQASILPLPDKHQLKKLSWAGNFQRLFNAENKPQNAVMTPAGTLLRTDSTLTLRVLETLGDVWPLSLSFDQLVFHTMLPEDNDDNHASNVLNVLWSLFLKGSQALFYCLGACPYSKSRNDSFIPLPGLAALNEPQHSPRLGFNYWHQAITLTEDEHHLIVHDGLCVDADNLETMNSLCRKGVITGSPYAWRKYLQRIIALQPFANSMLLINSLMLFTHYGMEAAFRIAGTSKRDAYARKKYPDVSTYENVDERVNKKINQLLRQGDNVEACKLAAQLVNEMPDNPHVWYCESEVFAHQKRYREALHDLVKAISIESTQWAFYYDYAIALYKLQFPWFAEKIVSYCLRFNPKSAKLWSQLCSFKKDSGNLEQAENCARKALAINPMHTASLTSLALIFGMQSRQEEAIPWLRKACESQPQEFSCFTNYLFGLLHSSAVSPEYLFAEHQRYGRMVARWANQQGGALTLKNSKDPHRRLRIGFVSGDLGLHPVTNFIRPIWDALNTEQFELYAYQTFRRNDVITHQLRQKNSVWCEAENMSPLELAKRIHQDEIDILIDLSGHTDHNRLAAFGLRPAPIAMSFIGYLGTTGLAEMDYYLLHNKIANPGELENQFTEALIYLPFNQQFRLFHDATAVATPTPAISNQVFTFGSFNRPSKINDAVLTSWAEILKQHENSRMLIGNLEDDDVSERFFARFAGLGIDRSRLIMRQRTGLHEYLLMHADVDLLLDTFPYPGGTTINYALQMGVPTLTLAGDTPIMRQGAAGMRQFDLDEFVATSRDEYVTRAVDIASDVQALNTIRLELRERVVRQNNEGGNPAVYLEAALREAWKRYCRGDAVTSFSAENYI